VTAQIAKIVTSGTFSLDGQDFAVDNNVWLIGNEREVIVVDAAHDPEAIKEARKLFGDRIEFSHNQYDILAGADALAVITDWSEYRNPDFDRIKAALKSPLIVDGRNLYKPDRMASAGFNYIPLGRCGGTVCEEVK